MDKQIIDMSEIGPREGAADLVNPHRLIHAAAALSMIFGFGVAVLTADISERKAQSVATPTAEPTPQPQHTILPVTSTQLPPVYLTRLPEATTTSEPEVALTAEQQALYDEISEIYGQYGSVYPVSIEDVINSSREEGEMAFDAGVIQLEAKAEDIDMALQSLRLFSGLLGGDATRYVNRVIFTKGINAGGGYSYDSASHENMRRIIWLIYGDGVGARSATLHEITHAIDVNHGIQDIDEYLRIQLIKAKISLILHNPQSVWGDSYIDRYNTFEYSPYREVGTYAQQNKDLFFGDIDDPLQKEIRDYINGFEQDGAFHDLDAVYVGLRIMEIKRKNPDYRFPIEFEFVFGEAIARISTEVFAAIVSQVLMGSGYYSDADTEALVTQLFSIVRSENVSLQDLQGALREQFYNDELYPVPYIFIPTE